MVGSTVHVIANTIAIPELFKSDLALETVAISFQVDKFAYTIKCVCITIECSKMGISDSSCWKIKKTIIMIVLHRTMTDKSTEQQIIDWKRSFNTIPTWPRWFIMHTRASLSALYVTRASG